MDIKINSTQPNFGARLILEGNKKLLKNGQEESLRKLVSKLGNASDYLVVKLPDDLVSSGTIWLSRYCDYIDHNCLNIKAYFDHNKVYSGIVNGLKKMNFREFISPVYEEEQKTEKVYNNNNDYSFVKQFHDDPDLM